MAGHGVHLPVYGRLMRLLTAVLFASLALVACGDDEEPADTITAGETPEDLRNLWEPNMEADAELTVIETDAGPMYLTEDESFAFGTCAASDALEDKDPLTGYVCNP